MAAIATKSLPAATLAPGCAKLAGPKAQALGCTKAFLVTDAGLTGVVRTAIPTACSCAPLPFLYTLPPACLPPPRPLLAALPGLHLTATFHWDCDMCTGCSSLISDWPICPLPCPAPTTTPHRGSPAQSRATSRQQGCRPSCSIRSRPTLPCRSLRQVSPCYAVRSGSRAPAWCVRTVTLATQPSHSPLLFAPCLPSSGG
jgi:hypothetical protein